MKIIALKRYPQRKQPCMEEESLILIAKSGIEGDCHADGSSRQLSLMTMKDRKWMDVQEVKGFCFKKFKENILIDIGDRSLLPGMKLRMGEALIRITNSGKACHPELCPFTQADISCELSGGNLFAEVISGGAIRRGDSIEIEV